MPREPKMTPSWDEKDQQDLYDELFANYEPSGKTNIFGRPMKNRKEMAKQKNQNKKTGSLPGVVVTSGSTGYGRCFETHPPLKMGNGTLIGGNCQNPMCKTADVYVGLDYSMKYHAQPWPWEKKAPGPIDVHFEIQDMSTPKDPAQFKNMIGWLKEQLEAGKTVHVGCIGGHGRTGMVISALAKEMLGEEDAITWTREHYCKKAVETTEQAKFLNKQFGIKVINGYKSGHGYSGYQGSYHGYQGGVYPYQSYGAGPGFSAGGGYTPPSNEPNYSDMSPLTQDWTIWGRAKF